MPRLRAGVGDALAGPRPRFILVTIFVVVDAAAATAAADVIVIVAYGRRPGVAASPGAGRSLRGGGGPLRN